MTHSSVTGQMPVYLMNGVTSIFPTDYDVLTWFTLPWDDHLTREELLEIRIRQLEKKESDVHEAERKICEARLKNKKRFDATHKLRKRQLKPGDWVFDAKQCFGETWDHRRQI